MFMKILKNCSSAFSSKRCLHNPAAKFFFYETSVRYPNSLKEITITKELPQKYNGYLEVYDKNPLLEINLPSFTNIVVDLPNINKIKDLVEPNKLSIAECDLHENKGKMYCGTHAGVLKIRRKKMNKHKFKKRVKRDRAKRGKILHLRSKKRQRIRSEKKKMLEEKIAELQKKDPNSTYHLRPYVVYRLNNW